MKQTIILLAVAVMTNIAYSQDTIYVDGTYHTQKPIVLNNTTLLIRTDSISIPMYLLTEHRYNVYTKASNFIITHNMFDDFKEYDRLVSERDSLQSKYIENVNQINLQFRDAVKQNLDSNVVNLQNVSDSLIVTKNQIDNSILQLKANQTQIKKEKTKIGIVSTTIGIVFGLLLGFFI